jgi:hypothetical protein
MPPQAAEITKADATRVVEQQEMQFVSLNTKKC